MDIRNVYALSTGLKVNDIIGYINALFNHPTALLIYLTGEYPVEAIIVLCLLILIFYAYSIQLFIDKKSDYPSQIRKIDERLKYCRVCGKTHITHPYLHFYSEEYKKANSYFCPRHNQQIYCGHTWDYYLKTGLRCVALIWLINDLLNVASLWLLIPILTLSYIILRGFFAFLTGIYLLRLVNKGEYNKAIVILHFQFIRHFKNKKLKEVIAFCLANCYFRKGSFTIALSYLDAMDKDAILKNLRPYYYNLYAANLLLAGQNVEIAKDILAQLSFLETSGEYLLWQGYLQLMNSNIIGGKAYIDLYIKQKQHKNFKWGFTGFLTKQPQFDTLILNYIIATYYLMMNNQTEAKAYLKKLAGSPQKNYFCNKAREMLLQA
jgi:hypothetical protein